MAFATGVNFTSPVIGGSPQYIFKPLSTVGSASDGTAPFKLGELVTGEQGKVYQFVRLIAAVANSATTAVAAGLSAGAASATSTWTNVSGTDAIIGDYLWLQSAGTLAG